VKKGVEASFVDGEKCLGYRYLGWNKCGRYRRMGVTVLGLCGCAARKRSACPSRGLGWGGRRGNAPLPMEIIGKVGSHLDLKDLKSFPSGQPDLRPRGQNSLR
jgi:hypothetical protein